MAIFSGICNATCFGNNSPNTKVIYDKINVTTTIATVTAPGNVGSKAENLSGNGVAAEGMDKNPAKIIATWIVAKKLLEISNYSKTLWAFLFTSFSNAFIFYWLNETKAISLA